MEKYRDIINSYKENNPQSVILIYYRKNISGLLYHDDTHRWDEGYVFIPTKNHIFPPTAGNYCWETSRKFIQKYKDKVDSNEAVFFNEDTIYNKHKKGLLKVCSFTDIWEMKREKELHRNS